MDGITVVMGSEDSRQRATRGTRGPVPGLTHRSRPPRLTPLVFEGIPTTLLQGVIVMDVSERIMTWFEKHLGREQEEPEAVKSVGGGKGW